MPNKCRGCIYGVWIGGEYYCNYLEITGRARQLICTVKNCTVRVAGPRIVPGSEEASQQRAHKYAITPADLARRQVHPGGRPKAFDRDEARALLSEGKTDQECAQVLGVSWKTFAAWRQKAKIPVNRKRRGTGGAHTEP